MSLFLSLFPTHFAVTARDSGLFVSAVQPGGPAEGKVCNAFGCCLAVSTSFPHTQILPVVASLLTPPSQVQAADVIMEIDGRLTSGLTAAEGANMPCTPHAFYEFFFCLHLPPPSPSPNSSNAVDSRRCDAQGPPELSRICSHRSLRNPVQSRNNARHCRQSYPEFSCCLTQHDTGCCREHR
jgi:hypothetical protein